MFQLYKKRSFGDMISDTFNFLKVTGKHFFKTFFTVTGIFMLILLVLYYFVSKVYVDMIFSSVNSYGMESPSFFAGNEVVIGILFVVFILLSIVVGLINYTFPISYFRLFDKKGMTTNFTTSEVIDDMKTHIGKVLIYFVCSLITFVPIFLVVYILLILLSIIIIGIPLMFIVFPAMFSWMFLTFYFHLNSDEGFFTSMGIAFNAVTKNFWSVVGSTLIIYIIILIFMGVVVGIPYVMGIASVFGAGTTEGLENPDAFSFFGIMMTIVMVLSMLVSFITTNLIFINQGMIYYSTIEQKENRAPQSEIDLIGTEE